MMRHPDPAAVAALNEGVLDDARAARIREHVKDCRVCQTAAADLAKALDEELPPASVARIDSLIAAGRPDRSRPSWLWLVPAGGVVAAAAIAWFVVGGSVEPPPVPEGVTAKATNPILSLLTPDRPVLPEPDFQLTVRGDAQSKPPVDEQIADALDRADRGDTKGAVADLESLAAANSRSAEAALALGALLLRDNRNAEAAAALERARKLDFKRALATEIDWFTSIALVRQPDYVRARTVLAGLCGGTGPRTSKACVAVAEIDRISAPR